MKQKNACEVSEGKVAVLDREVREGFTETAILS